MKQKIISVKGIKFCNDLPVKFLAGPCVIETDKLTVELAGKLVKIFKKHKGFNLLDCCIVRFKRHFPRRNKNRFRSHLISGCNNFIYRSNLFNPN